MTKESGCFQSSMVWFLLFIACLCLFSPVAHSAEKITLQLAWKHQFQFAGYYAAKAKGFYSDAGLDVTIVEGGEGKFAKEQVENGHAQYGVAGSELLLYHHEGLPFVVLGAIFQHSPSILLTKKEDTLFTPSSLINKKVMLLPGKKDADILSVFMHEGIPLSSITRLDQSYNLDDLINGKTDAVSAYVTNEPYLLQQKGVEPAIIDPATYGVDFYSDCLFTTRDEVRNHPDRVKNFREASLRGWDYAMAHPEEIIDLIIARYHPQKDRDHLLYEAGEMKKLIFPGLVEMGHMNPQRWQHIGQTFVELGEIPEQFELDGFLYDPSPGLDYDLFYQLLMGLAALLVTTIFAMLLIFNRRLNKAIAQKTEKLRRSEQRFESIFKTMSCGVVICEPGTGQSGFTVSALNPVAQRHCTSANKEIVEGTDLLQLFPGFFDIGLVEILNLVKESRIAHTFPVSHYLDDNQDLFIEGYACPLEGKPMVIIYDDVTQKQMIQAQSQRSHKLEALGTMAGGIAHDFNNILASILGFSELLKDSLPPNSPEAEDLDQIIISSRRAADLVRQILTFSRYEKPNLIPLDPKPVVRKALSLLRASTPRSIAINQDLAPDCATIVGDANQLTQVILNLGNNGVLAVDEEQGSLFVSLKTVELESSLNVLQTTITPGHYLVLEIRDNGVGIHPAHMERLFDPYFTTREVGEGAGMGLAVARGIVENHGGRVFIESTPGDGSSAWVYLPVAEEDKKSIERIIQTDLPTGNENILLVDDEKTLATATARKLEGLGYSVTVHNDPRAALAEIAENRHGFDLVVSDQSMPGMTGDHLISEIKALRLDLPIIICSGYAAKIDRETILRIGGAEYLLKPVTTDILGQTIRRILDSHSQKAIPQHPPS